MLWPKKNSYNEFDNEKKFLRLENFPPPPPDNLGSELNRRRRRGQRQRERQKNKQI